MRRGKIEELPSRVTKARERVRQLEVTSVRAESWTKSIAIGASRTQNLVLQRFACIGVGDQVVIRDGADKYVEVIGEHGHRFPLSPPFEFYGKVEIGGGQFDFRVLEPCSEVQIAEYLRLEGFHYRGMDLSDPELTRLGAPKKRTGGRRAVLLMELNLQGVWTAAGYIEIQMPLMMAKPRHVAFNRPFVHADTGVSWDAWVKGGQELVNRIARIGRVVVNPELRGARISKPLIDAAISFTRDRWHIGGKRALFLEISAEMLRFVDFVSSSGFHYLGVTEGNRRRLVKDLTSMDRGARGASGIMSLQRKYHSYFESYRSKTGESFGALQSRLSEILSAEDPLAEMSVDEWAALRPLIRSPIPYYMIGLDPEADAYVAAGAVEKPLVAKRVAPVALESIKLESLEVMSDFALPTSSLSRLVMDGFGIVARRVRVPLMGPLTLEAHAGTVTFVAGASGSGKSVLLSVLDPAAASDTVVVAGRICPASYKVAWLEAPHADKHVLEWLADSHGAERAFDALARVGLSEALLFLKPFSMLSRGQRYRAMLAHLMLEDADVWLVDEFCSDLDPLSAKIVARKFRDAVVKFRKIAIVAAANNSHFITALKPHRFISLRMGGGGSQYSWKEYCDGFLNETL